MLHIAIPGYREFDQSEGAAYQTLANADIVFTNILDALDCLQHPQRLIASLRR